MTLSLSKTLLHGQSAGMVLVLGASTADAISPVLVATSHSAFALDPILFL